MAEDKQDSFDQLQSALDFIEHGHQLLLSSDVYYGHGTDNAWDEIVSLVLATLNYPDDIPQAYLEDALDNAQRELLQDRILSRIERRLPLAYITQTILFAGIDFYIDDRALIPRSPIAELIEQNFSPWLAEPPETILDLCTGGGCIALACAAYMPESLVDGVDISAEALEVARINLDRLELSDRVEFLTSDLYDAVKGKRYDLIVTNPPYVDADDMAALPSEYKHEPELALASGEDGLTCTHEILAQAAEHLTEKGILILEVGNSAPALEAAYPDVAFTWLEFERGGAGVCLLEREQLVGIGSHRASTSL